MYQMGCIIPQETAFSQRLHDQRDVSLLEITNASVYELCTSRGGSLSKIALFQEQNVISPRSSVHRNAHTGCAAADNQHVPRVGSIRYPAQHFFAIHDQPLCFNDLPRWKGFKAIQFDVKVVSDRIKFYAGSCLSGLGIVMKKTNIDLTLGEHIVLKHSPLMRRQDRFFHYEPLSTSSFSIKFNPI
jgi:hypothetical protein